MKNTNRFTLGGSGELGCWEEGAHEQCDPGESTAAQIKKHMNNRSNYWRGHEMRIPSTGV